VGSLNHAHDWNICLEATRKEANTKKCEDLHAHKSGRRKRREHIQDNRNNNQKLAVASMLPAIVYLLPPSQFGIIPLILSKWCALFPVEETVGHLHHPMFGSHTSAYKYITRICNLPILQILPFGSSLTPWGLIRWRLDNQYISSTLWATFLSEKALLDTNNWMVKQLMPRQNVDRCDLMMT